MNTPEWRKLNLPPGLAVEHIGDVAPGCVSISGHRNGTAYAATVRAEEEWSEISIPPEAAVHGSARVVRISDFGVLGVCGATGLWGQTWHPFTKTPFDGTVEQDKDGTLHLIEVPRDEKGIEPAWLWVTAGDGNLQVTAAYPTSGGHEIRPLEIDTFQVMPVEQRLVTAAPLESIHIAAFAGRVTAAGPITDPDTLTVWWARSYLPQPGDPPDPVPWHSDPFEGTPSVVTDGIDWDGLSFFAGIANDGTVSLWDAGGDLRETTDVPADREDPVVLIAELEGWGDYGEGDGPGGLATFAVKTPSANVLIFQDEKFEMPAGRIRSAVLNRGYDFPRCFALIDDAIHVAQLEYEH